MKKKKTGIIIPIKTINLFTSHDEENRKESRLYFKKRRKPVIKHEMIHYYFNRLDPNFERCKIILINIENKDFLLSSGTLIHKNSFLGFSLFKCIIIALCDLAHDIFTTFCIKPNVFSILIARKYFIDFLSEILDSITFFIYNFEDRFFDYLNSDPIDRNNNLLLFYLNCLNDGLNPMRNK
jgi:hypothetical protein